MDDAGKPTWSESPDSLVRASRLGRADKNFQTDLKFIWTIEIPATWYRTPKWEFQKSAGGGAGTGAGKNGGAGRISMVQMNFRGNAY